MKRRKYRLRNSKDRIADLAEASLLYRFDLKDLLFDKEAVVLPSMLATSQTP